MSIDMSTHMSTHEGSETCLHTCRAHKVSRRNTKDDLRGAAYAVPDALARQQQRLRRGMSGHGMSLLDGLEGKTYLHHVPAHMSTRMPAYMSIRRHLDPCSHTCHTQVYCTSMSTFLSDTCLYIYAHKCRACVCTHL